MRSKHILFLSLLLVTSFSSLGSVVYGAGSNLEKDAPGQAFPPKFLDGNQIDLYEKPYRYPAAEPSYVFHGLIWENWIQLSSAEKLYFKYFTMKLTIDGEPIKLKKWRHHYAVFEFGGETFYDVRVKGYYVEFPAHYFEKGKYVFELRPTNYPTRTVTIRFY